jgi:hypothetical protein
MGLFEQCRRNSTLRRRTLQRRVIQRLDLLNALRSHFGCVLPILLPGCNRRGPYQPGLSPIHSEIDQVDILLGEAQAFSLHLEVIRFVKPGLHDAACGVPAYALQDVRDFMDQHVRQQSRNHGTVDLALYPVIKHHNMSALIGQRLGQGARQLVRRRVIRNTDGEGVVESGASVCGAPVDMHVNLREHSRRQNFRGVRDWTGAAAFSTHRHVPQRPYVLCRPQARRR